MPSGCNGGLELFVPFAAVASCVGKLDGSRARGDSWMSPEGFVWKHIQKGKQRGLVHECHCSITVGFPKVSSGGLLEIGSLRR